MLEALADWETFSNRFGRAMGAANPPERVQEAAADGYPVVDTMLTADPPEQRRFRKLVQKAFVPRRVNGLEPHVEALSHELIDGFAADGRVELVTQYAQLLPLVMIAEQLGVPREDLPRFRRWTDGFVAQLGQMADLDGQVEAAKLIVEFQHYFVAKLEERRAEPRDDFLTDLAQAEFEDEDGTIRLLEIPELLSIIQQLMVAGNETTTKLLNEALKLLIENPEEWERIRKDPDAIPAMVEEALRMSSPNQGLFRVDA